MTAYENNATRYYIAQARKTIAHHLITYLGRVDAINNKYICYDVW